jgi:hypothetical protein
VIIEWDKNTTVGLNGTFLTAPSPKGISGCPVWTFGRIPEIVYGSKKSIFVGMGIENKRGVLVAVRAWLILQIIRLLYPDLASVIPECPNVRLNVPVSAPARELILDRP